MSNKTCCVPGCFTGSGSEVLHKFPNPEKYKDLFNTWLHAVGGEILGLENSHIFKYRRICQIHFEEKYWCRNNRLSNIAVPTKQMPGFSVLPNVTHVERRPLRPIQNIQGPSTEPATLYSVAPELCDMSPMSAKSKNITETVTESLQSVSQSVQTANEDVQRKNNNDPVAESACSDSNIPQPVTFIADKGVHIKINRGSYIESLKKKKDKRKKQPKKQIPISKTEECLRRKLIKVGIQLSKCRSIAKKQKIKIKAMQKIVTNPEFIKILDNLTSTAKILILLQFRECKKGMRGRRFTLEEKIMALSIFKQSPKGYRFFRKIFILPSPTILVKLLSTANIKPGINKKIMNQIKKATQKMKIEHRLCIVLFDEMALKSSVAYNERKDNVSGFVTDGTETRPEFADHAQVFMVRGLVKNYKQPVAYTFSQAATKGAELSKQLKQVITELQNAGLIVVATVCDQGTNNMQCIKLLMQEREGDLLREGKELKNNSFFINDQEIIPLYDPPHLIKCMRNNLITKNLKYKKNNQEKTAKWSHIENLHSENPGYRGIRLVPKLTDYHCVPTKIPKQKVKFATQIFSQTVGTNMGFLADKGILAPECKETADILIFFDGVFDSVNGSFGKRKKHGKPLLGPVTPTSPHHKVWEEARRMMKDFKFVNTSNAKVENVPTIKNWVWTLEGFEYLTKNMVTKYGLTSLWLRHCNQDPIENFFGSIRSHGCRNVNPSADKFESAYATLLVNSLSSAHAPGANCETDNCYALSTVIITESDCIPKICDLDNIPEIVITPLEDKAADPRKIAGLQYVGGYFLKKTKKHVFKGCLQCKQDLISDDEPEYIKYREYSSKKWLCSPNNSLLCCISSLQDINYIILKKNLEKNNIQELIKTLIVMFVDFEFLNCDLHKEELISFLLKVSCRFFIHNYCKEINNILRNKRECDDDSDSFKLKAKKYHGKCFKRKNK